MMAVNGIRRVLSVDRLRFSSQFLVRTLTNSTKAKTNHSQPSNQGADHDSNTETTHFGYETVTENEKTAKGIKRLTRFYGLPILLRVIVFAFSTWSI